MGILQAILLMFNISQTSIDESKKYEDLIRSGDIPCIYTDRDGNEYKYAWCEEEIKKGNKKIRYTGGRTDRKITCSVHSSDGRFLRYRECTEKEKKEAKEQMLRGEI